MLVIINSSNLVNSNIKHYVINFRLTLTYPEQRHCETEQEVEARPRCRPHHAHDAHAREYTAHTAHARGAAAGGEAFLRHVDGRAGERRGREGFIDGIY